MLATCSREIIRDLYSPFSCVLWLWHNIMGRWRSKATGNTQDTFSSGAWILRANPAGGNPHPPSQLAAPTHGFLKPMPIPRGEGLRSEFGKAVGKDKWKRWCGSAHSGIWIVRRLVPRCGLWNVGLRITHIVYILSGTMGFKQIGRFKIQFMNAKSQPML